MRLNKSFTSIAVVGVVALAAVFKMSGHEEASPQVAHVADQVVLSFEREFDHEPVLSAPAERESIDQDELYKTANAIHWTAEKSVVASSSTRRSTDDHEESND